jgi:hypothetical protein
MKKVARGLTLLGMCLAAGASGAKNELPSDSSDATHGLNLTGVELKPVYEADFSQPLAYVRESDLFENARRVRKPPSTADWVLEGKATARVAEGRLYLTNDGDHLVFWNTRRFPADFLLEFSVSPHDANNGLNIVFFAATALDGGSIFELQQPLRDGVFKKYHTGDLNSYHVSYWAATNDDGTTRGTPHVRKNRGFHLVAAGKDFVTGQGAGPHRVRILKVGGRIDAEVNGKLAVRWTDDGRSYGPVLRDGFIGLRQMAHTRESSYTNFKVWAVTRRIGDR